MNPPDDTLNISPLRPPVKQEPDSLNSVIHPDAAAAARARIAALAMPIDRAMPSLSPAKLHTDRNQLLETVLVPTGPARYLAAPIQKLSSKRIIPSAARPLVTAVIVFLVLLALLKSPIIYSEIKYAVSNPTAKTTSAVTASTVIPAADTISIPKINVYAPVIYINSTNNSDIDVALESGVIHYGTTPLPGAGGNSVLFGHSSNDWWQPGNYKFIFTLLDKLTVGDEFTVDYNSVRYTYRVNGSKIVPPTDVGVLDTTTTPTMTLITCTPPGTSIDRLVVTANQISVTTSSTATTASTTTTTTPTAQQTAPSVTVQPGFFERAGQVIVSTYDGIKNVISGSSSSSTTTDGKPIIPAVK